MDDGGGQLIAVLAIIATALGSMGALGQFIATRGQRRTQEAAGEFQQRIEWKGLVDHFRRARLAAIGPDFARGVSASEVDADELRNALLECQAAETAYVNMYDRMQQDENYAHDDVEWDRTSRVRQDADSRLDPFRDSVRAVVLHLGHVALLVLRGRLSIESAYAVFGPDVSSTRDELKVMTTSHPEASGCPGSYLPELRILRDLKDVNEISRRVGWGTQFAQLPGLAHRVRAFGELLHCYGTAVGDIQEFGMSAVDRRANYYPVYVSAQSVSTFRAVRLLWRLVRWDSRSAARLELRRTKRIGLRLMVVKTFLRDFRIVRRTHLRHRGDDLWLPPREEFEQA